MTPTKTTFDKLVKKIKSFEKEAGFDKTSKEQLTKWLEDEIKNYKNSKSKIIKGNKLMDIIVLVMQIAERENISLDDDWKRWWKKSEKYLRNKK